MQSKADNRTRTWLAIGIVVFSIVGITTFSVVGILTAKNKDSMTVRVLTSVLPLFGTWVGTVLAFYFARDNLQAATDSAVRLQGLGGETGTPVTDVMIKEKDIVAYDLPAGQTADGIPLQTLRDKMSQQSPPSRRLPIRDATGAVQYVLHDSTLIAYFEKYPPTSPPSDTFGHLLQDGDFKALVEAIGYVSEKASVADARKSMGSIKNCNDVFVTATGKPEERATGWLTNTLLAGIQ